MPAAVAQNQNQTDVAVERTESQRLGDTLSKIAIKQLDSSIKFKQPRIDQIKKSEDLYLGVVKKALKGRVNVALPIMQGFVDTLRAKIDDKPRLIFEKKEEADLFKARKVQSSWDRDSSPTKAAWARKDRGAKMLATFSGRAIYKLFAESDPEYKSNLEIVDHHDFHCEPMGGAFLEDHLFVGQTGIFRTGDQLLKGSESGWYDSGQVSSLKAAMDTNAQQKKNNADIYKNRVNRYRALGLNPDQWQDLGVSIYHLVEWFMVYNGDRYHVIFDYDSGKWLRCVKLTDDFESNLWPYVSWATHEDLFNFWSKSPCDDMRPLCDVMNLLMNQAIENRQKMNWGQRAYDPNFFPDPSQLEWSRPDGLVIAEAHNGKGIGEGIYEFKTPEIAGTINLFTYLDQFLGQKTGITPSAQGATDKDAKVGVYYGDLQQVADRMGLYNKAYTDAWGELALRYIWALREHLPNGYIVRILGAEGAKDEELIQTDLEPEFDIKVISESQEAQASVIEKKQKADALTAIVTSPNPTFSSQLNPRWVVEQILRNGGYNDEEIRVGVDTRNDANQEVLAVAAESIQMIVKGIEPKIYRGATTGFVKKIVDYCTDSGVDFETWKRLMAYADAHLQIAQENLARKATMILAQRGMMGSNPAQQPALPAGKTATPENTAAPGAGVVPPQNGSMMDRMNPLQ